MRKLIYIFSILLVVSCVKHGAENLPESRLEITAEIAKATEFKAVFEGTSFNINNTIGLFVYHSETKAATSPEEMSEFSIYGSNYRNVKGVFSDPNSDKPWKFGFESTNDALFDDIYLLRPTAAASEAGLAVVAYAPWIQNVERINSIPFTLGGESEEMVDLLWARQNTHDSSVNNIDPGVNYNIIPDGNVKPVNFTFQHALSMLRIGLRCRCEGSVMTISSIQLKRKEGASTPLYVSGSFNAMTGQITNPVSGPKLEFNYTAKAQTFQYSATDYTYVPLLIAPLTYKADGDYILEFKFNEQQSESKYEIKLSDVAGGFKPGVVYTFNFTVDNYIQLDGVTMSNEWVEL